MLIGLCGKKGSGKNLAAKALVDLGFRETAFATPLRAKICSAFKLHPSSLQEAKDLVFIEPKIIYASEMMALLEYEFLDYDEYARILELFINVPYRSYRELLQIVGTNIFRNQISQSYWIDSFEKSLVPEEDVVVTDTRFPQEREIIARLGGKLILLEREGLIGDSHESENSLGNRKDHDFIIENNGSVKDLRSKVVMCYNSIAAMDKIGL